MALATGGFSVSGSFCVSGRFLDVNQLLVSAQATGFQRHRCPLFVFPISVFDLFCLLQFFERLCVTYDIEMRMPDQGAYAEKPIKYRVTSQCIYDESVFNFKVNSSLYH